MNAAAVLVALLATAPSPDSLQTSLLGILASPHEVEVIYVHDKGRAVKVLAAESAWSLAAVLGVDPQHWDDPAFRDEWCARTPGPDTWIHLEFRAGEKLAVVEIDLVRACATLASYENDIAGRQDVRDRWESLIGHFRKIFPGERSLKSLKPCPRTENAYTAEPADESTFTGRVDEIPKALEKVAPVYPDIAREAGVDGRVTVLALVGKDGRVLDAQIVKSIPMLDQAALDCVRKWKFRPAQAEGQPAAAWVEVPVLFSLD